MSIQQSSKRKLVLGPSQPTVQGILPIAPVEQLLPKWCWAACIAMATTFKGNGKQQCQVADDLQSRNDCCWPSPTSPNPRCNFGANAINVEQLCRFYGYGATTVHMDSLNINQIQNQIGGNHPVYAVIQPPTGTKHMVLVKGWEIDDQNTQWVYYNDPEDGSSNLSWLTILQNGPMGIWDLSVVNM